MKLIGQHIIIEEFCEKHYDDLKRSNHSPELWSYQISYHHKKDPFDLWFYDALEKQKMLDRQVFTVIDRVTNQAIGTTSHYDINSKFSRLKIGYTWYLPDYWGGAVNPECKLLMLQEAFEGQNMKRVGFEVDERNQRSIRAVTKLGAKQEGILRKHIALSKDFSRNTVVFSIIDEEWPDIKMQLEKRVASISS